MKNILLYCFALLISAVPCTAQTIDQNTKNSLAEYIKTHYQSPEDYVLSKFKDHDIVFLGEMHRIKQDPELVQKLIPLLHRAGVYYLGYEFARRAEQPLIDSLIQAPTYNEQLARHIIFKNLIDWGYQEYADIFKATWELNRTLPVGKRKFRILGLNNSPDWSILKTPEDRDKPELSARVWHGETEEDWAKVLLDTVIAHGEKALVYCGIHHAFTEYQQPIVINGKFVRFRDARVGNFIFQKIGKRAITIFLHAPWYSAEGYEKPLVLSADGYIDAILRELEPNHQRVGFDVKGTPLGKLSGETSIYKFGHEPFTLDIIYDGYICQGPLSSYKGVTAIRDFINESNLDEARTQCPNPILRNASADIFNKSIEQDANIARWLSTFK